MEFGNGFLSELVSCFDLFSFCSPFSYFSLFAMLMKMDKVAKAYNASFVVSSSELGEYDSLMQNVRQFCFYYTYSELCGYSLLYFTGTASAFGPLIN